MPGSVTKERAQLLQKADAIVREEIEAALARGEIAKMPWQWFAILLPVKSVGVMGDARSYGETIAIRCVQSLDAMTADWAHLPHKLLAMMSTRITNEVHGISRVLYDITQKPPGTIEWE
jgi:GMP synthase (glutamine-hydrolysing)